MYVVHSGGSEWTARRVRLPASVCASGELIEEKRDLLGIVVCHAEGMIAATTRGQV